MNPPQEITIIIADDHPMVREGLRSMLRTPGFTIVGEVATGEGALRLVRQMRPDVILMDIRMNDMDGITALQAIRRERLATHVIMVTTYPNTTYLLQSLAAGASGFILKDISRQELLATVREVVSGAPRVDRQFLERVLRDLRKVEAETSSQAYDLIEPLTPREMDVLHLLVEGMTNQGIARALGLRESTVKGYVQTILEKLDAKDRTHAAVKAIRMGLVQ